MAATFGERAYIGLAGEFRVMAELLLRGLNPSKSYLQNGYDLILDSGIRIEVKSSHRYDYRYPNLPCSSSHQRNFHVKGYRFCFRSGSKKKLNKEFDFAICWCIDDDVFYIIPVKEINGGEVTIVDFSEKATHKFSPFRNNWDTLKEKGA